MNMDIFFQVIKKHTERLYCILRLVALVPWPLTVHSKVVFVSFKMRLLKTRLEACKLVELRRYLK